MLLATFVSFCFKFAINVSRDEHPDPLSLRLVSLLDSKLLPNMLCVALHSATRCGNFLLQCFRLRSQTIESLMKIVFVAASKFKF